MPKLRDLFPPERPADPPAPVRTVDAHGNSTTVFVLSPEEVKQNERVLLGRKRPESDAPEFSAREEAILQAARDRQERQDRRRAELLAALPAALKGALAEKAAAIDEAEVALLRREHQRSKRGGDANESPAARRQAQAEAEELPARLEQLRWEFGRLAGQARGELVGLARTRAAQAAEAEQEAAREKERVLQAAQAVVSERGRESGAAQQLSAEMGAATDEELSRLLMRQDWKGKQP